MRTPNYDDWTVTRWKLEPRFSAVDFEETPPVETAPPLWKDLTLAAVVAVAIWIAAAAMFG